MAHYNKKKDPNMKVVMNIDPGGGESHSEVWIFIGIDTSGSMAGGKINQVCCSLQEIILKAPGYVRFVIRKFDKDVVTLVSKKKRYLDIERLNNDLKKCGSLTALYDAFGQIINEIPYDVSKLDAVHVLIFTDGADNCSQKFNLESIIELVNNKMNQKVRLTFIQAGSKTAVANALESKCSERYCKVIKVENSVDGINYGFSKAKQHIRFEIALDDAGFLAQIGGLTLSNVKGTHRSNGQSQRSSTCARGDGLLPLPGTSNKVLGPVMVNTPRVALPICGNRNPNPSTQVTRTGNGQSSSTVNVQAHVNSHSNRKQLKSKPFNPEVGSGRVIQSPIPTTTVPVPKRFNYPIQVGQIPARVTIKFPSKSLSEILLEHFGQWGDCEISKLDMVNSVFTATISYDSETKKNYALQYGGRTYFHGTLLSVRDA